MPRSCSVSVKVDDGRMWFDLSDAQRRELAGRMLASFLTGMGSQSYISGVPLRQKDMVESFT